MHGFIYYSLIAFDERVNFWLQHVRTLPCARAYVALFARSLRISITQLHTHTMQQTHTHKAVTRRLEAKKLFSRQRQLKRSQNQDARLRFTSDREV